MPLGFLAFQSLLLPEKQACEWLGKLIDFAHWPVMYISKNITVNCQMQNV